MGKNDYVPAVIGVTLVGVAGVAAYIYREQLAAIFFPPIDGQPPILPPEEPPGEEEEPSTPGVPIPPPPTMTQCSDICGAGDCEQYAKQCTKCCSKCLNCGSSSTYPSKAVLCKRKYGGGCSLECMNGCATQECIDCHKACGGTCTGAPVAPGCEAQISGNCVGDCLKTCWNGIFNGTLKKVCVQVPYSIANCQVARSQFCTTYGPCAPATAAAYAHTRARMAYRYRPDIRSYRTIANGFN